jgi:hypothetical protein
MAQVRTRCNVFLQGQTKSFEMYSDCHILAFEYGDVCPLLRKSNLVSCLRTSTQLSQMRIQYRSGPKYTQQGQEQGSCQYLQPFEGCRYI